MLILLIIVISVAIFLAGWRLYLFVDEINKEFAEERIQYLYTQATGIPSNVSHEAKSQLKRKGIKDSLIF